MSEAFKLRYVTKIILFVWRRLKHKTRFGIDVHLDFSPFWLHFPRPRASWKRLGPSWGACWDVLGDFSRILDCLGAVLGVLGGFLEPAWACFSAGRLATRDASLAGRGCGGGGCRHQINGRAPMSKNGTGDLEVTYKSPR